MLKKLAHLGGTPMILQDTVLVQPLRLVDLVPTPPPTSAPPSRTALVYSERLFLKALVVMIVRRLHKAGELLAVLAEPTPGMRLVRRLLADRGAGASSQQAHLRAKGLRLCPRRWRSR